MQARDFEISIENEDERVEREWFEHELDKYLDTLSVGPTPPAAPEWELIQ